MHQIQKRTDKRKGDDKECKLRVSSCNQLLAYNMKMNLNVFSIFTFDNNLNITTMMADNYMVDYISCAAFLVAQMILIFHCTSQCACTKADIKIL